MNKNFIVPLTILLGLILVLFLKVPIYAHSGRTDASGDHWDHSNGTYHYHNGPYAGRIPYSTKHTRDYGTLKDFGLFVLCTVGWWTLALVATNTSKRNNSKEKSKESLSVDTVICVKHDDHPFITRQRKLYGEKWAIVETAVEPTWATFKDGWFSVPEEAVIDAYTECRNRLLAKSNVVRYICFVISGSEPNTFHEIGTFYNGKMLLNNNIIKIEKTYKGSIELTKEDETIYGPKGGDGGD